MRLLAPLLAATAAAARTQSGCSFTQLMDLLEQAENTGEQTTTQRAMTRSMWQECVLLDEADALKIEVSARCGAPPTAADEPAPVPVLGWLSDLALPPPPPAPPPAWRPPPPPRDDDAEGGAEEAPVCDFTSLLTCSEAELKNETGDPWCLAHKARCYQVARSFADDV